MNLIPRLERLITDELMEATLQQQISRQYFQKDVFFEFLTTAEQLQLSAKVEKYGWDKIIQTSDLTHPANAVILSTEAVQVGDVSTVERRELAILLDSKIKESVLHTCLGMARMIDEKLYKELGFNTARDYFGNLSVNASYGYELASIGRAILSLPESVRSSGHLEGFNPKQLSVILRSGKDEFDRLATEGKTSFGDEEFTAEQLKDSAVKELRAQLKVAKQQATKAEILEKEVEIEKLKREKLEKENERLLKEASEFNPALTDMQAVTANFEQAEHHYHQIQNQLNAAASRIEKSGNEHLMNKFCEQIERLEIYAKRMRTGYVHFFIERS